MSIRLRLSVVALIAGIAVMLGTGCQFFRAEELDCSGSVSYGQRTFPDRLILKVLRREVKVSGQAGEMSTFEAGLTYKICFESQNELDFEYSANAECANKDIAPHYGHLNKVFGNLRMSRLLGEQMLLGNYKCEPAERVIK